MKIEKFNENKKDEKICEQFLEIVTNIFSYNSNFFKVYNDSKNYHDYDEIVYVFDGIDNDKHDPNSTLQMILKYMRELGWLDENLQIMPMMENNKLYVCFTLGHGYDEMKELIIKNTANKYNL